MRCFGNIQTQFSAPPRGSRWLPELSGAVECAGRGHASEMTCVWCVRASRVPSRPPGRRASPRSTTCEGCTWEPTPRRSARPVPGERPPRGPALSPVPGPVASRHEPVSLPVNTGRGSASQRGPRPPWGFLSTLSWGIGGELCPQPEPAPGELSVTRRVRKRRPALCRRSPTCRHTTPGPGAGSGAQGHAAGERPGRDSQTPHPWPLTGLSRDAEVWRSQLGVGRLRERCSGGGGAARAEAQWQGGGQAPHPPTPAPHPAGSAPRCGCVTMLRSPNKTTAVKQWEQRWIKNCLCGGLWRRVPLSYP